ncbi:methyltransferase [Kutzneria sp. NPDC052558]|uniref:methyltransferase n=1 Tax=Kutzneria sp. NPDC052558 TaxID=3364121 RepID=UPI0037C8CB39
MGTPSIMALADLATPMSIRVAATLGLHERAAGGATAEQLAAETGASAPALGRVLDHLVGVGVFARDGDRYRTTELGHQIRDFLPILDTTRAGGRADLAFVELLHTVTTGGSAYEHRYGRDFWDDLDANVELRRSFDAQMAWRFKTQGPQIAQRYDWSRFPRIVDLGGGDGNLLTAILVAHPSVRGEVLDYGDSATAARERFAAAGVSDRAGAIGGSFFDPLPTGADAYVLCDILHNWDDDSVRKILTACRNTSGTVIVIEAMRGRGVGTAMDLSMLMCFGGRERTVDELAVIAAECGFRLAATTAVADHRTALEFVPV